MAQLSQMHDRAKDIKNQTKPAGNTATMVGGLLEDIVTSIEDHSNNKADKKDLASLSATVKTKADITDLDSLTDIVNTKADKSAVDALSSGVIKQEAVPTYAALATTYPNLNEKNRGWDVLVLKDERKYPTNPKPNRYVWNGAVWIDMHSGVYGNDVALKDELATKTDKTTIENISQTTGIYNFKDSSTARDTVSTNKRSLGQIITYRLYTEEWITERFIGADVSVWNNELSWESIDSSLMMTAFSLSDLSAGTHLKKNYLAKLNDEKESEGCISIVRFPLQRNTRYTITGVTISNTKFHLYPSADTTAIAHTSISAEVSGAPRTFITPNDKDSYFSYVLRDPRDEAGYGIYDLTIPFEMTSQESVSNILRTYFDKKKTSHFDIYPDTSYIHFKRENEVLNSSLKQLSVTEDTEITSDGKFIEKEGFAYISPLRVFKGEYFTFWYSQNPKYLSYFHLFDFDGTYIQALTPHSRSKGQFFIPNDGNLFIQVDRKDIDLSIRDLDQSKFKLTRSGSKLTLPNLDIKEEDLLTVKRGNPPLSKIHIPMNEVSGHIRPDGVLTSSAPAYQGVVAISPILNKNTCYLVELGSIIQGRIVGAINAGVDTRPIAIAGRKTFWFKTDERDSQKLHLYVKSDLSSVAEKGVFDVTGKYKVYQVDESEVLQTTHGNVNLPSVGANFSNYPSAILPEPQWVIWNLNGNYPSLTSRTIYSDKYSIIEYLDSNGSYFKKYAQIGGQGSGSMTYENRNSKFKLYNQDGSKFVLKIGDWLPRSTYHFKVNYVDFSQVKNQGIANYITDWYRDINDSTKKTYPWNRNVNYNPNEVRLDLYDKRPRAVIASVPAMVCTHWNPWSQATMNINAFAENFKLDAENKLHRGFRGGLRLDKAGWEEMCSDTKGLEMTDETWQSFKNFTNWIESTRGASKIEEFKEGNGVRYDKDDMIDYWLMAEFMYMYDNGWANMVWVSYDSKKFTPLWYDMDTAFGTTHTGGIQFQPNQNFTPNGGTFYWEALVRAYPADIKERYIALRQSGRFSVEKIRQTLGSYIARFPYEWYEMDFYMWVNRLSIKEGNFSCLERYLWFIENRLKFLDSKYGYIQS